MSQCAFGWVAMNQFCVSVMQQRMTWSEAETECNRNSGHLVSIRSEDDQKIIDQLLMNSPGYKDHNAYWIGASDRNLEGDFRWSDSLPFSYTSEYILGEFLVLIQR
jgi:hypothetical protein